MITKNYLAETYRRMADDLDPAEEYFSTDSRFMALDKLLQALPPGKFCDLGCGRGLLLNRLSKRHQVYGTEFDSGLVSHCQSLGINVKQVDLNHDQELPFRDELFDMILISEVCEHLLDPRNAIRLARRSLSPNGTLVVTVPNAVPLFARVPFILGRSIGWLHYPSADTEQTGHLRFYTAESMSRLLQEESFKVSEVRGVSFRFNGRFWQRLCYWTSRFTCPGDLAAPARIDAWLGKKFPRLSPGLLFVARPN
jgi:2-polyprenyl-3-methyl-5-hydroxy-6-metoxy-1,4-benzoquinol methylase